MNISLSNKRAIRIWRNRSMRHFLILVCITACHVSILQAGDGIISNFCEHNGQTIDFTENVLVGDSTIIFHLNDDRQYYWKIYLQDSNTGACCCISKSEIRSNTYSYEMAKYKDEYSKAEAYKYKELLDGEYVHTLIIEIYDDYNCLSESKKVIIRLIPLRPKLENIKIYIWNYDSELDSIYPNGDMKFEMSRDYPLTKDYNYFYLVYSDCYFFKSDFPNNTLPNFPWSPVRMLYQENKTYHFEPEWGMFVRVRTINFYGSSAYSDAIFTTDYIEDENILARLQEIYDDEHNLTGIINLSQDEPIYEGSKLASVIIYDIKGNIVSRYSSDENCQTNLPPGLYIVKKQYLNGNCETSKIIIK